MSPSKRFFAYRVSSQYGFSAYAVLPEVASDKRGAYCSFIPAYNLTPPPTVSK